MTPSFSACTLTLNGVVFHEEDFLFPKHKEDLAHRIRISLGQSFADTLGQLRRRIGFDDDGDIRIRARTGTIYASRRNTFFTADQTVEELIKSAPADLAKVTSEVFALRSLEANGYGIRISFDLSYTKPIAAELLKANRFPDLGGLASLMEPQTKVNQLDFTVGVGNTLRNTWFEYESRRDRLQFGYFLREEPMSRTFPEFFDRLPLGDILEKQIKAALESLVLHPDIEPSGFRS